jgi:hypothetical protein
MEPAKEADFFVDLAVRFLAPSAEARQEGYKLSFSLLQESGPARQGAFKALALLPPPEKDSGLLELYRQNQKKR